MATPPIRNLTNHPLAPPYNANDLTRTWAEDWQVLRDALVNGTHEIKVGGVLLGTGQKVDGVDVSELPADITAASDAASTAQASANAAQATADAANTLAKNALPLAGGTMLGHIELAQNILVDGIRPSTHRHAPGSPNDGGQVDFQFLAGNLAYSQASPIVGTVNGKLADAGDVRRVHENVESLYGDWVGPADLDDSGSEVPAKGVSNSVTHRVFSGTASTITRGYAEKRIRRANASNQLDLTVVYKLPSGGTGDTIKLVARVKFFRPGQTLASVVDNDRTITLLDNQTAGDILSETVTIPMTAAQDGDTVSIRLTRDTDDAADDSSVHLHFLGIKLDQPIRDTLLGAPAS